MHRGDRESPIHIVASVVTGLDGKLPAELLRQADPQVALAIQFALHLV
jgi:hypothetical protein